MMKETWETPRIAVEKFAPNEYVSSCLTVKLECAIPGTSPYAVDDGTSRVTGNDGLWHGSCGDDSEPFVISAGKGYETRNGHVDYNRIISNVQFGNQVSGSNYSPNYPVFGSSVDSTGTYFATWDSTDGSGIYKHYGRAIVTRIDNEHPNHS